MKSHYEDISLPGIACEDPQRNNATDPSTCITSQLLRKTLSATPPRKLVCALRPLPKQYRATSTGDYVSCTGGQIELCSPAKLEICPDASLPFTVHAPVPPSDTRSGHTPRSDTKTKDQNPIYFPPKVTITVPSGRRGSFDVTNTAVRKLSVLEKLSIIQSPLPEHEPTGTGAGKSDKVSHRRDSVVSMTSTASIESSTERRRSTAGTDAKARWARANWYALQKVGSMKANELHDAAHGVGHSLPGNTLATMSNVVMFAKHWRRSALAPEKEDKVIAEGSIAPKKGKEHQLKLKLSSVEMWFCFACSWARCLLTAFIIIGWDLNVLLDDSGKADVGLYCTNSVIFVAFGLDIARRLAFRQMSCRCTENVIEILSFLSLLPDFCYFFWGVDVLKSEGRALWPVAIRALHAGVQLSMRIGIISNLLLHHRHKFESVPNELRAIVEKSRAKRRVAVNHLLDLHTTTIVTLLLLLHYVLKLLASHFFDKDEGTQAMLSILCSQYTMAREGLRGSESMFDVGMDQLKRKAGEWEMPILHLRFCGDSLFGHLDASAALRPFPSPLVSYEADANSDSSCTCELQLNGTTLVRRDAIANLVLMAGVMVVIVGATRSMRLLFERDVVTPLEEMQRQATQMFKKPFRKARQADHTQLQETLVVEKAMTKFTSLLRLSLGEAGGKVVTANLSHGNIDRNLPGNVVNAIFGFCDIRQFTELTELLQADVLKLVNTVAWHVHHAVTDNYGDPNKNIGDAFLLVWKPNRGRQVQEVADSALRALVEIVHALRTSSELSLIVNRSQIQQRMPGCRIQMGFGLHFGWAVEGAIGSSKKIDASYLSPTVNLAARLESATKQYGVPILVSEQMRALLSPGVQQLLRLVDRVVVKGSSQPMKLYTFDIFDEDKTHTGFDDFSESRFTASRTGSAPPQMRVEQSAACFFKQRPPSSSPEYRAAFQEAMDCYLGGGSGLHAEWPAAKRMLQACRSTCPQDKAASAILEAIERSAQPDGTHPAGWEGYRALTDK